MISLKDILNESKVGDEAKRLGLEYMSFGRYGKDGKVTHKSADGKLVALKTPTRPKKSKYPDDGPERTPYHSDDQQSPKVKKQSKSSKEPKNAQNIRQLKKQLETLRDKYEADVAKLEKEINRVRKGRGTKLKKPRLQEPIVPGPDPFGGWR